MLFNLSRENHFEANSSVTFWLLFNAGGESFTTKKRKNSRDSQHLVCLLNYERAKKRTKKEEAVGCFISNRQNINWIGSNKTHMFILFISVLLIILSYSSSYTIVKEHIEFVWFVVKHFDIFFFRSFSHFFSCDIQRLRACILYTCDPSVKNVNA